MKQETIIVIALLAWMAIPVILGIIALESWLSHVYPPEQAAQFAKEHPELVFGDWGFTK